MTEQGVMCDVLQLGSRLCALARDEGQRLLLDRTADQAGLLSTFSGLLAAIAFASLMIIITNPPEHGEREEFSFSIYSLCVVFALLILATFLFIPVTGVLFRPEQEVYLLIADTVLSLGVVGLFFGICWFFAVYGYFGNVVSGLKILFYFALIVVALHMSAVIANASNDIASYYNFNEGLPPKVDLVYVFLVMAVFPLLSNIARWLLRGRVSHMLIITTRNVAFNVSLFLALLLTIYYVYIFSGVWDLNTSPLSPVLSYLVAGGLGFVFALYSVALPVAPKDHG